MGDFLSQEEIDALLDSGSDVEIGLSSDERDALGEVGNIGMASSATTLSQILGKKVNISTPVVEEFTLEEIMAKYPDQYITIKIEYTKGFKGISFLILYQEDVKKITDIMMGGDGTNTQEEITPLHISAISEAMNQMVGSSSTSISSLIKKSIDISPPKAEVVSFETDNSILEELTKDGKLVSVSFNLEVEDLINSKLIQFFSMDFSKEIVKSLLEVNMENSKSVNPDNKESKDNATNAELQQNNQTPTQPVYSPDQNYMNQNQGPNGQYQQQPQYNNQQYMQNPNMMSGYGQPQFGDMQQYGQQFMPNQGGPYQGQNNNIRQNVNVQPANFQAFDNSKIYFDKKNVDIIMDVPLQITVELGRTNRLIKDILEFCTGSIIELDKLAGEPVDILVNGKIIAKGEVVVIDESFGVRITEIVQPSMRL